MSHRPNEQENVMAISEGEAIFWGVYFLIIGILVIVAKYLEHKANL